MRKFLFCFLLTFFSVSFVVPKVVIFDLGKVLLDQDKFTLTQSIGFGRLCGYYITNFWRTRPLQPLFYEVLHAVKANSDLDVAYGPDGELLPAIMTDWLKGTQSPETIRASIHAQIERLDAQYFFVSHREKKVLRRLVDTVFEPSSFAKATYILPKGKQLVNDCKGSKENHTLMVLSNWDAPSFALIKNKFKEFFDQFDHIFISGELGLVKPNKALFAKVLEHAKAKGYSARDCFFIDDIYSNIESAQQCGITGLWFKNGDYADLREQMAQLNLL